MTYVVCEWTDPFAKPEPIGALEAPHPAHAATQAAARWPGVVMTVKPWSRATARERAWVAEHLPMLVPASARKGR